MKKFTWLLCVFFLMLSLSCRHDDGGDSDISGESSINDFVWKGLNSWYYWQKDVPNLADQAFSSENAYQSFLTDKEPDDLFYSLLYNYGTTDRFSWIVEDVDELLQQFSGISKSSGMDVSLGYKTSGKELVGIVNYVIPDSPADQAGVKRGDVIAEVNGASLTVDNYSSLFSDHFTMGIAQSVSVTSAGVITSGIAKTLTINAAVIEENPVAFYKTFDENGKKIGYLVYNGFRSNYNDELNTAFGKMKQDGVTDLILDLRYNGGGSVETAVALGQMITGQFTGSPYVLLDFNDKHSKYNETYKLEEKVTKYDFINGQTQATGEESINSLHLSKVYVLTSSGTASASELTINGLQAYVDVVLIGGRTYGKFVGSITLYDSPKNDFLSYDNRNKSHNFAMQPITFAYYNANRDEHPSAGITPDYSVSFFDYLGTLGAFGDTSDIALSKAIQLITGHSRAARTTVKNYPAIAQPFFGSTKTFRKFGTELYQEHPLR